MDHYPKRLIEVDLPIKCISGYSRREKQFPVPRGHIATMHTWWARRPLAACRAVICAAVWPDPFDPLCPDYFRDAACETMNVWANKHLNLLSNDTAQKFIRYSKNPQALTDPKELRDALLSFISDFSQFANATNKHFIEAARKLTQIALLSPKGEKDINLLSDPFSGGGAIPLEALRVGLNCFSSDINSVAVLIQKVALEYLPRYRQDLIDQVTIQGQEVQKEVICQLKVLYPTIEEDWEPLAFLWARTVRCEGPKCGVIVPLMRTLWICKKRFPNFALKYNLSRGKVEFDVFTPSKPGEVSPGTVKGGSATCPICGYTMKTERLREQLRHSQGGADAAILYAVIERKKGGKERRCRIPSAQDLTAIENSRGLLQQYQEYLDYIKIPIPKSELRRISVPLFGMDTFADLFNARQLLASFILVKAILNNDANSKLDRGLQDAVTTTLAIAFDKIIDFNCSLSQWRSSNEDIGHLFGRQAIGMVWDFAETNLAVDSYINWERTLTYVIKVLRNLMDSNLSEGTIQQCSALESPLPDDSCAIVFTDPPYYDSVPYSHLSDFFYTWLRLIVGKKHPNLFSEKLSEKKKEIVVDRPHSKIESIKTAQFYEDKMCEALAEARRVIRDDGIGVIIFAHKSTSGWEALLSGVINAGWKVTASWPIDTESSTRTNAMGTASLASSIHLICRPRGMVINNPNSSEVGLWRDVLNELPKKIHDWMPRLAKEGVVGADAIFACLGPALEIFSRYSRVEKASGEQVTLKEYLEKVWAAVSREALAMIFSGADATGFEEDARLTAMWLWTLSTGGDGSNGEDILSDEDLESEDEEKSKKTKPMTGFVLEYDAARKIAQGLGAHLDKLKSLVEIKGETARLLFVAERATYLFGKDAGQAPAKKRKTDAQLSLFEFMDQEEQEGGGWQIEAIAGIGHTILDQLHQSMILFAAGRGEALKRFLVEEGIGRDHRYWRLAQALSALYPAKSDEKRWVDGVLARKKGLGF